MKVYLVGAGPGDPGLLTLRAKALLERADAVVYDYLAAESLLGHCRPDVERIYVGKQGGDHTLPQDEISSLLVAKAREGKVVVRLKGGDPYVFGRGAEEAETLVDAGVEFEVVPGVTSAVAALAYAGIPLTHRAHASAACLVTGHEDPAKAGSAIDWEALARSRATLVFYMGMKNLPDIAANLMAHGLPGSTPAAVVRWGTTCMQRSHAATLDTIAEDARRLGFAPPALIVVGGVASLRDRLGWFEKRPLLGRGVVVTRAREQASGLAEALEELGACVIQFPTIAIRALDDYAAVDEAIRVLAEYDWIVFTSANGVRCFWERLEAAGLDSRALGKALAAAMGPGTAEALRARGVRPDLVPAEHIAEGLAQALLARGAAGARVLIPRALQAREVLPEELRRAGCRVDVTPVYRTAVCGEGLEAFLDRLEAGGIHCVTFASSSTVDNFFALVPPDALRDRLDRVRFACIGPVTAATLERYGFKTSIQPGEYAIPALVRALAEDLGRGEDA